MPDWEQNIENAVDGSSAQQQSDPSGNAQGAGNDKKEDTMVDSAVDQIASKEGLPAGFDPEVNNLVNDEVNKF